MIALRRGGARIIIAAVGRKVSGGAEHRVHGLQKRGGREPVKPLCYLPRAFSFRAKGASRASHL
jgi:hypothetical protein